MNLLVALGWTPEWESEFAPHQEKNLEPARVLEEQKRLYLVGTAHDERHAILAGRLYHEAEDAGGRPAVGDWVALEPLAGKSRIHHVLPRRTAIVRKEAFRRTAPQVVAANVDTVFIVTSLNRDFNPRRLERYLTLVWESGARPVLILNKADLCADAAVRRARAADLALGAEVHAISARTGDGVDAIEPYLGRGETTALIGSSGVGKSTLVNRLAGEDVQAVKEIRADDDRGRHTTTNRRMIRLRRGGLLVDTPGLREVGLWDGDGLETAFADVEALAARCRFRDCRHGREPGCAVQAAIRKGALDRARFESYGKLKREAAYVERRQSQQEALNAKRRWKRMTVAMRKRKR